MLSYIWINYLNGVLDKEITQMIIYSDVNRIWLANALVDAAISLEYNTSFSNIDEFEEEDIIDIINSIQFLNEESIIVVMYSDKNPRYPMLESQFNQLFSTEIKGNVLFIDPNLPNEYATFLLQKDVREIEKLIDYRVKAVESTLKLTINNTLIVDINEIFTPNIKFKQNNLLNFPQFMLRFLGTIQGFIGGHCTLSPVIIDSEIVDFGGPLGENIIELTPSINIKGDGASRISEIIEDHTEIVSILVGIIESPLGLTGFYYIDRTIKNCITILFKNPNFGIVIYNKSQMIFT